MICTTFLSVFPGNGFDDSSAEHFAELITVSYMIRVYMKVSLSHAERQ